MVHWMKKRKQKVRLHHKIAVLIFVRNFTEKNSLQTSQLAGLSKVQNGNGSCKGSSHWLKENPEWTGSDAAPTTSASSDSTTTKNNLRRQCFEIQTSKTT